MTDLPMKDLCELVDLDESRIRQLAKEGVMVRAKQKGHWHIEMSVLNYIHRIRDEAAGRGDRQLNEESALLKRAQRQHFELKNAELEGSLVSAVDVEAIMRSDYATAATRLLGIPSKVAPRVAAMRTAPEVEALLHSEFVKALNALSKAAGDQLRKLDGPIH
jgi:phage terminase Nu1 subunit (DNA packaging protein)